MTARPPLAQYVASHLVGGNRALIAFSGGMDSHVLLDACVACCREASAPELLAVHVNHGLHPTADDWSRHCASVCRTYGVNLVTENVCVRRQAGHSLEETARLARYTVFKRLIKKGDILLLAHHQDDQAETMLLQLLRGAGLRGLSAMPEVAPFGDGTLARPFLSIPRLALQEHAQHRKLVWIEDPSNQNPTFDRNFLRHQVMPLLQSRWPGAQKALARSASHCAEAERLLSKGLFAQLETRYSSANKGLDISGFDSMDADERRWLVRAWLKNLGLRPPPTRILDQLLQSVVAARHDAQPEVVWSGIHYRRYRGYLHALTQTASAFDRRPKTWDGQDPLPLPGNGQLVALVGKHHGIPVTVWRSTQLTVRYRDAGMVCDVPGRGRHTLKNLMHEWGIPPWMRDQTPLVFLGDQLVAVPGAGFTAAFGVADDAYVVVSWVQSTQSAALAPTGE